MFYELTFSSSLEYTEFCEKYGIWAVKHVVILDYSGDEYAVFAFFAREDLVTIQEAKGVTLIGSGVRAPVLILDKKVFTEGAIRAV